VNKLLSLALTPEGDVKDEVAALLLERLTRSELKSFLATLLREMKRRHVYVSVAGDPAVAGNAAQGRYPGREVDVARDESLGAGVRISAGDDIVDASVRGYVRGIIEELEGT
jgi:hypothetical protein